MHQRIPRLAAATVERDLGRFPVVALVGPRQCSSAPTVTRGFHTALADLGIREAYVVAPVRDPYPLAKGVEVVNLDRLLTVLEEAT